MSTNQIVIINNVALLMFACLVGLSICDVNEANVKQIEWRQTNITNNTSRNAIEQQPIISQSIEKDDKSSIQNSSNSYLIKQTTVLNLFTSPSSVKLNDQTHSSNDHRLRDEQSTSISIDNVDRAKRSTTANYRLNYKTKFKNYYTSSTSSAKTHHSDNQLAFNQASLTNDLNNAEITYSNRLTTLNRFQTDLLLNDALTEEQVNTLRPNISNTSPFVSLSSFSLPNYDTENKKTFENTYSIYPNGFYTSKSYDDLYTQPFSTTDDRTIVKTTKSTKNNVRLNRKSNVLETTSTSLLPLLLFDKHQLAQEINFTTRNLSTPSPFEYRGHNARTFTTHHNFYTTIHHSSSHLSTHTSKAPRYIDRQKNSNHHTGVVERHNVRYNARHGEKKGKSIKFQTAFHSKSNQSLSKQENDRLPMIMNTNWPKIEETSRDIFNNYKQIEFNLATTPVPKHWQNDDLELKNSSTVQNIQPIELLSVDPNSKNSNRSQISTFSREKLLHDRIDHQVEKIEAEPMQNDEESLFIDVITMPLISSSSRQKDRHDNTSSNTKSSILSPATQNLVTISLGLVIIITIIGNTLVCLSPIYFRKLRHPSNYLLISLALSDLGVALLVMPIALYKELHDVWSLGTLICDIFLGLDVTCCTASILHLCVICIDRYLTITRPFTYAVRRKSSRSLILISIVWTLAIVVCLPPLLVLGNVHGTKEHPICDYCNDFFYQLYATLGAFYIPLLVMLILYYKIYEAAKKVIEAEHKSQCSVQVSAANTRTSDQLKSYNSSSSSYTKQVNTCPAHPNSLTLSNENQFVNNVNNVEKSIDHHRTLLKQSTVEKSDSTNCSSCGQSLEQQQNTSKANNNRIDSSLNDERNYNENSNNDRNSSKNVSKDELNNKIKCRKCLFTMRKSKENNAINNLEDECLKCENDHGRDYTNNEEFDKMSNKRRNKKLKKKIRTPDVKHKNNVAFVNQPLLESTRTIQNLDHNLEFIDQIDQVDKGDLCDKCWSNLAIRNSNSNDTNNNLNNDDFENEAQIVLECNTEQTYNQLNRNPTSFNCKSDYDDKFVKFKNHDSNSMLMKMPKVDTKRPNKTAEQLKNRSINLNIAQQQISSQPSKKIHNSSLRERKASITLGVIMCAFIFCWLPFFILALLRPFASQLIPDWASSVTLWLGYLNSMLNPLIYVTFHQDFRRAFKYILLCRCKVMKSSMRKEAYNVQYG